MAEELIQKYNCLWYIYEETGLTDKANDFLKLSNKYARGKIKDDPEIEDDIDWGNRVLCSDPSCIGIIGPDGHCKECGKKFVFER